MTLPASGAISFNAINIELGKAGTTQGSLNDTDYRTLAGVASGTIDLNDFWGKSNSPVYLPASMAAYDIGSSSADCSLDVINNGNFLCYGNDFDTAGTWLLSGSVGDYDVQLSETSNTGDGGVIGGLSLNTWYNLATTRTWTYVLTGSGKFASWTGSVSIRKATSPFTVYKTSTVTMECDTI